MAKDSHKPLKESKECSQNRVTPEPADESAPGEAVSNQARDTFLSEEEAESGSPEDVGTAGEEDPGAGLEFLINDDEDGH